MTVATDRLTIPVQCPACDDIIALPTSSRYDDGRQVVAIDRRPVDDHIRDRHPEARQTVTVHLDNRDATFTPRER